MKVTGKTITDEQIRELRVDPDIGMYSAMLNANQLRVMCSMALNEFGGHGPTRVSAARAVCADAWNARHGADE